MRTIIVIFALLSLTLVTSAETLNYQGDVPGDIAYYTGSNASGDLWDYVYSITDWNYMNTGVWGIVCPFEPTFVGDQSGWTTIWYSAIPDDDTKISEIWGQPGVVWKMGTATNASYFHFQSTFAPTMQPYDGDTWTGSSEYSASPEPASIILSSLALGFVLYRRRQKSQVG